MKFKNNFYLFNQKILLLIIILVELLEINWIKEVFYINVHIFVHIFK